MRMIEVNNLKNQQKGYTTRELMLSGYIILVIIIAIVLIISDHNTISKITNGNTATITKQNGSTSTSRPKSDPVPTKYVNQTVSGHDFKVTLMFDPNAYAQVDYHPNQVAPNGTVTLLGNDEVDIIGNPIGSSNQVIISVVKDAPSNGGIITPKEVSRLELVNVFTATIMGTPYIIYGYTDSVPGTIVNILVGQTWYTIRIDNYTSGGVNRTTPISATVERIIMNSISIKQ